MLIKQDTPTASEGLAKEVSRNRLSQASENYLEVYCLECKAAVGVLCYLKGHNSRKCAGAKDVDDDLAPQLTACAEGIKGKVKDCKSLLKNKIVHKEHN